ncbi:MAG: hypothetical protein NT062_14995, partial [Proteobacteria bacterium]|nr:hypothetical protein [Pseudomonadota bacterium]
GWIRCFIMHGTSLTVNLALPAIAEARFAAAEVFGSLSRLAIDGSVTARIGDTRVDCYASGDDD